MRDRVTATGGVAITLSDTVIQPAFTSIYVGGTGTLVCDFRDGLGNITASVTYTGVPVGTVLYISPARIRTTSTATLLVGNF
jgi:ABC-type transporter Mla subunit MlaD